MYTAAMFTQEKITKASKVCWQKSHWQVLHRQIRNGKITRAKVPKYPVFRTDFNFAYRQWRTVEHVIVQLRCLLGLIKGVRIMWWKKHEGKENKPVLSDATNGYFAKLILVKILAISATCATWLVIVFHYKILSMIWIIIRVIWTVNNLRIVFHDGAMATLCVNGGSSTRRIKLFLFSFPEDLQEFFDNFFQQ